MGGGCDELAKLEPEHAELGRRVTEQRRRLPSVPVKKEYEFDTEDGKETLAELFDGRSELLVYNIMFGPDYELGGRMLESGDERGVTRVHLSHRDVRLICVSRAPIDRLVAYEQRMGLAVPYVSTNGTDFPTRSGRSVRLIAQSRACRIAGPTSMASRERQVSRDLNAPDVGCGLILEHASVPTAGSAFASISARVAHSSCRGEPTYPHMKYPPFSPMPIAKPSPKPCSRSQRLKRGSRTSSISRAAATDRSAWSSVDGALKTARMPSPH
jgi:hypothetical protein